MYVKQELNVKRKNKGRDACAERRWRKRRRRSGSRKWSCVSSFVANLASPHILPLRWCRWMGMKRRERAARKEAAKLNCSRGTLSRFYYNNNLDLCQSEWSGQITEVQYRFVGLSLLAQDSIKWKQLLLGRPVSKQCDHKIKVIIK